MANSAPLCHGRSSANAIKNAIRVAKEFAESQVNSKLEAELSLLDGYAGLDRRALV